MLVRDRAYRRPPSSDSIPSHRCFEAFGVAPITAPICDICERFVPSTIQPWVEKAKRWSTVGDQGVIDQREDSRARRGGSGCAVQVDQRAVVDDVESLTGA